MKKNITVGLDIGSNSIGWAVRDDGGNIIDGGSRIFTKAVNDKTPTPKNVTRREARLTRRRGQRLAKRKARVRRFLVKVGLLPTALLTTGEPERIYTELGDPYVLAAKGLHEELSPYELGRVIQHSAARRGFKSNRKSMTTSKEDSAYLKDISDLQTRINDSNSETLREFLNNLPVKRNRKQIDGSVRTNRAMWKHDLESVLTFQKRFHSDVLTEEFCNEIIDIIFYQRPIVWDRKTIGYCQFEPKKKRAARATLEAQRVRYYQDINYLTYRTPEMNKAISLSPAHREILVKMCELTDKLSFAQIKKACGFPASTKLNLDTASKNLFGNRTGAAIASVYPQWHTMCVDRQYQLVEDMTTILDKDEGALEKRLMGYYDMSSDIAKALANLPLEGGYCNISKKAANKLLVLMRDGVTYSDAKQRLGYDTPVVAQPVALLSKATKTNNPIVDRALSEVHHLVNDIINKHGKPARIVVEMARDLEANTKKYVKNEKQRRTNKKLNEKATEVITEILGHCSRNDREKHKLWNEQNQLCVYSGKTIGLSELLSDAVEVDHILPYSRAYDDSFNNKVICLAHENQSKGNNTPHEAYSSNPEKWEQIIARLDTFKSMSEFKKKKFFFEQADIDKLGMPSQMLNDTRYICKETLAYLKTLGCTVTTVKGIITARVRNMWGLNQLLGDRDEKNRKNNLHHMVDAAIVSLISPKIQELLSKNRDWQKVWVMPPLFKQQLETLVANTVPSQSPQRAVNVQLHEDTGLGIKRIKVDNDKNIISSVSTSTVPLNSDFKENMADNILCDQVRKSVKNHFKNYVGNPKEIFNNFHTKRVTIIKNNNVSQETLDKMYLSLNNNSKYVKLGKLHHAVIYKDKKNKYITETTYTITALQRTQAKANPVKLNDKYEMIMTLYKGSLVSLLIDGTRTYYYVTKFEGTQNRIALKTAVEGNELKYKSASALLNMEIRLHYINRLGEIRDVKTNN